MEDSQQRQLDRFTRVRNFAASNAADFGTSDAQAHTDKLAAVIAGIERARTGQKGASAVPHQMLLLALKRDCQDISRTGRAIAQEDFGFDTLFPYPNGSNHAAVLLSLDTILASITAKPEDDPATVAAKAARVTKLAAHGLSATLPADLAASRTQYMTARDAEDTGDTGGVEDTAAIKRLVTEGRKECGYLDATFHNLYRRNPDKLAGWKSANNVEDAPGGDDEEPPAPPAPPAP